MLVTYASRCCDVGSLHDAALLVTYDAAILVIYDAADGESPLHNVGGAIAVVR